MKTSIAVILSFLFSCLIYSQEEQVIKITNQNSQKEIVIKENKRVKIKTLDGRKISGRINIDKNSIIINNERFELENITEIKRNPLLTSVLTSGFLVYGGVLTAGFGVLIGVLVDSTAFWLTIPAAGMIYAGIKSPNFNRKYTNDGSWTFQLITITN